MTNEQKYKTAEERAKEFKKFCSNRRCSTCPYKGGSVVGCSMKGLADEYKYPEQDLPFEVDVLDVVATDGKQTIAGCCDEYNATSLCNRLNAAALAWHKRMMENEGERMSDNLIQWPKAKYWTKQWNPVIGCKPCSPACENCYAAAWANRFGQSFEPHEAKKEKGFEDLRGGGLKKRLPNKGVVFCGNMTDLFGEWLSVADSDIYIIQTVNRKGTYIFLTKRADKMCAVLRNREHYPSSECTQFSELDMSRHYFGFTAENQEWYDNRMNDVAHWPYWAKNWLSLEPLLGPIDLTLNSPKPMCISWVVVGCESGPNRRPCKIEWVESIVKQCMNAKIPVFVKQLDIGGKCVTDINKFPAHLQIRQVPWAKEGGAK